MRFINQAASDRAVINAGGRRFETLFSTLHRYPDTPFAQLFPLPGRGARQHRGREFFLDVTPHVFEYILGFLRTNQLNLPAENLQIRAEVVYSMNQWGLLEHAFPPEVIEDGEGCSTGGAVVKLPDVCVVQVCDHMQHDQGVKRHALTITYGADGFQLRSLIRRVRRDLERQLSSTYWQCYQTNERAAFFVTTKVANGTADLLTTSVTQQLVEHTESMGYSLASSYVTLSPDVVHTSVRMLIHNFTFRRSRRVEVEPGDGIALGEGSETIEAEPNIPTMHVGPRREPLNAAESIPPRNERAVNIWTVD
ncbi:potassium voltage-gated channel, putative [Trypanosoma brucei gambiense DAL972]|uniref:Potassium voltage-gated channel, putative n=2 Tax=Trypanosoma brucei TaxID=5691 RepID=Q387P8_TRYB2|nr:potassium voltage-gated channel, putative [Trypanosoma brucei gambiense DAL972]XP_828086.1 potassium voltage-gated channel, putative [Trypanosoma brucei brucei TREU927]6SGA_FQ Chain FQ, mt-SAF24 [Trypanosoma brucei brucei]6SGA_FR Chain FR, mt-SAF24 [Trypanosoma brucei brucei]6SGA_FS Chain FS, mt-SAF24 [Trypanosoma brucei brucei]6SGA_FT Chain FT, mt-SAF24 [Trypanosoma brucei brucei]6SGA_FU Chain FU, mt-SAF24 [Trypanosoma brucei brucei]6SGB_FQ Chain FQ, mt-SAF24 [Trypanosoma brucei brucei]|eukprot:XP_011779137.1 potassium voltage-gated channel, putative [Trypanosoma brucei gambiense DAL972]